MKTINVDETTILPEFIETTNQVLIPNKLHKSIDFIPEHLLLAIHSNINVAKELCLLFTSYLNQTQFVEDYLNGKDLQADKLAWQLRLPNQKAKNTNIYTKVIKALEIGTPEKGPIINVERNAKINVKCYTYNLTDTYKTGVRVYTFKTKIVKDIKKRNTIEAYIKANTDPIAINLLRLYSHLEMPTTDFLLEKGKQLAKEGYTTKKGKKLTMQYRKDKSYWKDADNRSFVEQDIELYEMLTKLGFMIPIIGGERCPRVYDTISLMPSWIRSEIKLDGKKWLEADYSCLHPNLAINIYGGKSKFLTHKQIADELNLTEKEVKISHLSFFNMSENKMKYMPVYNYYNNNEKNMLDNIINEKVAHNNHAITSWFLFDLEKQLMTNVVKKLNNLDIYVGYAYDAFFVSYKDINTVAEIMNETALEMKIFTNVKTNSNESKIEKNTNTLEVKENSPEEIKLSKEVYLDDFVYQHTITDIYALTQNKLKYITKTDINNFRDFKYLTIRELLQTLKEMNHKRKPNNEIKVVKLEDEIGREEDIKTESELFYNGDLNKGKETIKNKLIEL